MNNFLIFAMLTLAAAASAQTRCPVPKAVVRVDAENQRLFAIGTKEQVATANKAGSFLKPLASYIESCQSGWTDWSVSVFADRKFTKYKTEIASHDMESWSKAYVAEYSSREHLLVLNPSSPNNRHLKVNWRRTVAIHKLPHGYRVVEVEQQAPPELWEAVAHFNEFYFRSRKLSEQVGQYFISPSGKYALFEDPGVLLLFNARTGKTENVTDGAFAVPSEAEWSEDERTVVVTYFEGHKLSTIKLR